MPSQTCAKKSNAQDRAGIRSFLPTQSDQRAWLISCVLHIGLLLMLVVWVKPIFHGTFGKSNEQSGIAVSIDSGTGGDDFLAGGSASSNAASNAETLAELERHATANVATAGTTSLEELVADLMQSDGAFVDGATLANALGTGTSGTGTGNVSGAGTGSGKKGNGTTTNFLGVSGTGSSFVYILDRSDSMNAQHGSPLFLAKRELLESIGSLSDGHQFQIIFYNDSPNALSGARGGKNRLLYADKTERGRAEQFVRGIIANGGTEHLPALRMGLAFGPDIIFFMTDGERPGISETEMNEIRGRAAQSGTTIHTIQFRSGPPEGDGGWIRALAERNRGIYRYVNINDLKIQ